MSDDETKPYSLAARDGRYAVLDGRGNTLLECRDQASAEHYIELVNRAHALGYKAGYRAGKKA